MLSEGSRVSPRSSAGAAQRSLSAMISMIRASSMCML